MEMLTLLFYMFDCVVSDGLFLLREWRFLCLLVVKTCLLVLNYTPCCSLDNTDFVVLFCIDFSWPLLANWKTVKILSNYG